jgi:hypothetical protein
MLEFCIDEQELLELLIMLELATLELIAELLIALEDIAELDIIELLLDCG